jgi:hypothetical protein
VREGRGLNETKKKSTRNVKNNIIIILSVQLISGSEKCKAIIEDKAKGSPVACLTLARFQKW